MEIETAEKLKRRGLLGRAEHPVNVPDVLRRGRGRPKKVQPKPAGKTIEKQKANSARAAQSFLERMGTPQHPMFLNIVDLQKASPGEFEYFINLILSRQAIYVPVTHFDRSAQPPSD